MLCSQAACSHWFEEAQVLEITPWPSKGEDAHNTPTMSKYWIRYEKQIFKKKFHYFKEMGENDDGLWKGIWLS